MTYQHHLRQQAENTLRSFSPEHGSLMGAEKLLHELQVHQIELELQNKELSLAKLALEASHAHYLELYDFAPVGYITLNAHDCVTECNLTATKMLGVQRKLILNKRFVKIIDDEFKDLWHHRLQKAKQAQEKYSFEFPFRHANGAIVYCYVDSVALKDKSEQDTLRLSLTDITSQKHTEKSLRDTETQLITDQNKLRDKMEQVFRLQVAVQTAVAIANEINQPLTALSYCADVAESMASSGNYNPKKLADILKICSEQALRAGKAIPHLLSTLLKAENPNVIAQDINETVRHAIMFFKAYTHVKCKIQPQLAIDLPLVAYDDVHIEKTLVNLMHNGLDAMQQRGSSDGEITVSTCIFANDPGMVKVTVANHGPSEPDTSSLKKIFDAFYTTKPGHLGMGLAVSRALVEAQGGGMWAEENSNKGISVCFTLPIDKGSTGLDSKISAVLG